MSDDDMRDHLSPIEEGLDEEGLFHARDDDEDALRVAFKSEGDRYFVISYRDDPSFVMLGSGWALPIDASIDDATEIANALNVRKKFAKTAIWDDQRDVLFTIELCVSSASEVRPHLARLIDVLRDTASEFFDELRDFQDEDF